MEIPFRHAGVGVGHRPCNAHIKTLGRSLVLQLSYCGSGSEGRIVRRGSGVKQSLSCMVN